MPWQRVMRLTHVLFVAACTSSSHNAIVTLETPIALPTVRATPAVVLATDTSTPSLWGVAPGMTREEVAAHLGAVGTRRTREETKAWWTDAGYDPKIELPFIIGFDEEISYNDNSEDLESPVWNVYFERGRSVLYKVAIYGAHTKPELARFGFPPSCFVGADASGIAASLGQADFIREGGARRYHYYLRRGIMVMEESGLVHVFDFFTPLDVVRARAAKAAVQGQKSNP